MRSASPRRSSPSSSSSPASTTFLPYTLALTVAVLFVVLSQVKINVTNAYSGSLRWTNFFSTVFKWYPGRVYFVFFNVAIALVLMEANMFSFLNELLGFYSNVAIAWIGAVVADLVINKPLLKTSPSFIEFKRGHLPAFNPVGFGAMGVASVVSIAAYFGAFGEFLDAWSPFLAITIALILSPTLSLMLRPEGLPGPHADDRRPRSAPPSRSSAACASSTTRSRTSSAARSTRPRSARCAARSRRRAGASARTSGDPLPAAGPSRACRSGPRRGPRTGRGCSGAAS